VLAFDGQVFEILGFADTTSYRMPVEVIDEVILDDDMFSVLSNPEKGDSYGIQQPVKPSDEERTALQELADAVQGAAGGVA
jgi:methyl coenzyme M reductase gamma subunit